MEQENTMDISIPSTDYDWQDNAYVKVYQRNKHLTCIEANREGLFSLADQLKKLADRVEKSILYEEWPGDLEEGSVALEIRRVGVGEEKVIVK